MRVWVARVISFLRTNHVVRACTRQNVAIVKKLPEHVKKRFHKQQLLQMAACIDLIKDGKSPKHLVHRTLTCAPAPALRCIALVTAIIFAFLLNALVHTEKAEFPFTATQAVKVAKASPVDPKNNTQVVSFVVNYQGQYGSLEPGSYRQTVDLTAVPAPHDIDRPFVSGETIQLAYDPSQPSNIYLGIPPRKEPPTLLLATLISGAVLALSMWRAIAAIAQARRARLWPVAQLLPTLHRILLTPTKQQTGFPAPRESENSAKVGLKIPA